MFSVAGAVLGFGFSRRIFDTKVMLAQLCFPQMKEIKEISQAGGAEGALREQAQDSWPWPKGHPILQENVPKI